METLASLAVIGCGGIDLDLSAGEMREIIEESLADIAQGERVLAVIADKTRDDNTDVLFPFAAEILDRRKVARFDALVAQGTHPPMSEEAKLEKVGAIFGRALPALGTIFDHRWDRREDLVTIGELGGGRVSELTGGLIDHAIPLEVNRLLGRGVYDTVLVFGATVPHEVAGFAGGAKYFFPGVSGPDLTHATHWLGALAGIEEVIGRVETPTRRLIEAAADYIRPRIICFVPVLTRTADNRLRAHALFAGDFRQALRRAAAVSGGVHIKYTGRKYARVVALLDRHYDELWVGGKASYKLGAVVEDGGELIIYAPHMTRISETHGAMIERYGYAPLEVVREWVATSPELQSHLCVAAHLAHVSYAGRRDAEGRVVARYRITLASGIDDATCRRVKLGFLDHRSFDPSGYKSDPETLVVDRAGADLYLVDPEK